MCLAQDGEEPADLHNLQPEQILLRWLNYHLGKAGQPLIVNIEEDLKDCKALLYVMNQIDSSKCNLDGLEE